jgi:uncharacterized protein YggE
MKIDKSYIPFIIISVALILSAIFISQTGIYIKNTGGVESNGQISNTISVTGDGKISAKPDMVILTVSFEKTASTSKSALDQVNKKIEAALKILKNNNIPDSDIVTTNLNIYTEYDYSSSTRRIIGQRASQSLEVKIKKIDEKATKATKIIDELSAVEDLQIGGISFDIEDKTEFFTKARELAFQKAKQKAEELAKLSRVKLAKPIYISDSTYDVSPVPYLANVAQYKSMAEGMGSDQRGQISTGEMNISSNLSILWGIE